MELFKENTTLLYSSLANSISLRSISARRAGILVLAATLVSLGDNIYFPFLELQNAHSPLIS
jgi:hypothetical protein